MIGCPSAAQSFGRGAWIASNDEVSGFHAIAQAIKIRTALG
jgi:hypothetical protein